MQRSAARPPEHPPKGGWADRTLVLLILSLTVNLVIGHGIWRRLRAVPPVPASAAEGSDSPTLPRQPTGSLKAAAASPDSGRFVWTMLQSADPKVYADRLRAVDCPPPVVRRIITAQLCEEREYALSKVAPPPFWASPAERLAAQVKQFREQLEIVNRFDQRAREAVGSRWLENTSGASDWVLTRFIFEVVLDLPDFDSREDMISLMERMEWLERRTGELPCLSSYRENQRLNPWREAQFNSLMSPAQQHDFKKHFIGMWLIFSSQADGFRTTGAELEQARDLLARELDIAGWDPNEAQLEPSLRPAFQAALPAQRLAEFRRVTDRDYRRLVENIGDEEPRAKEMAKQFYESKQANDRAWVALLEDRALSQEQRDQSIQQLRREQTALAYQIFGEQILRKMTNSSPYWLYLDTAEERR